MIDPSSLSSFGATVALAFLGDLAVKATVVLLTTALLDFRLGRKRPLARCGLWYATLAALAVLPLASRLLPPLAITRSAPKPAVAHPDSHFIPHAGRNEAFSHVRGGGPSQAVTLSGDGPGGPSSGSANSLMPARVRYRSAAGATGAEMDWASIVSLSVLASYLLGAVVLTIRLLLSLRAVAALSGRATPLAAALWNEPLADWRRRLAVAQPVKLLVSPELTVPVQIGWLRPAILLPPRVAASCDDGTRAAVLVHELGHVRRGDYLWNLVLRMVAVVYWPHPLVWFAERRIGQLREQACDDLCVHWLGGAEVYRSRLIELAAGLLQKPVASLGMAMSKTAKLSRRLAALDASPGRPHCVPSALARRSAIAAMLLVAAALGALTLNRSTAAAQESKTRATENPPPPAENPAAGDKVREQPPAAKPGDAPKEAQTETAGKSEAPAADQPVRVRVGRVKRHDFTVETSEPCLLEAARTMAVYARVPGEVKRLLVELGDHVVKGQTLAELDAPQLAPQVAQAEALATAAAAELEQSRAAVREAEARLASSDADGQGAEAEVEAAEVKLTYATKRYTRIRQWAKQNAASDEQLDEAEEELSAAKAGMKIAKSHSESVKAVIGPREAVVAAAQATAKLAAARLRVAEAELARVKLQGGETKIVSPLEGVVIEMDAQVGDAVGRSGKNDRIGTVADLRQMRAMAAIPERDALKIKRGGSARVFLDAFPGKIFPAKVSQVGFNIGPARTMRIDVVLASDDADVRLLPGMDGAAAVALEVHRDALSMPLKRYTHNNGVLKVVDGRAENVRVKFGGRSHDRLEILSGLQEGDIVIIDLVDGRRPPVWEKRPLVEIVEPEEE